MTIKKLEAEKHRIELEIRKQRAQETQITYTSTYVDVRTVEEVQRSIKDLDQTITALEKEVKRNILLREPQRNSVLFRQIKNWQEMLEKDYQRLAVIEDQERAGTEKRIEIAKSQGLFNVRVLPNGQVVGDMTQRIALNYD